MWVYTSKVLRAIANVGLAKHLADNWLIFLEDRESRRQEVRNRGREEVEIRRRRRNARIKGWRRREREEGCRNSAPASLDLRVSRRRRRWRGGLIFYVLSTPSRPPPLPLLAAKETSTNFVSPSYRTKPSWLLRPATWRRLWADAVQLAYRRGEGEGEREFDSYSDRYLMEEEEKKKGLLLKIYIFFLIPIFRIIRRDKLAEEIIRVSLVY